MNKHLRLTILTPEKEFYRGEILSLNTESYEGRFGVLANHVAMISPLKPTITKFVELDGKVLKVFTKAGVLRVQHDEVEILCSDCEWLENIDVKSQVE